ncbi:MAG TPA: tetratricopeptide repeat protein [Gemmatimonadales bacterium]|nr:tetratricopeptide repeat protein [Gemmatimonadales bacterium]
MAYTSEIDKLEARYRENPKGRNFAPLADAYRKAGLIDNAVELCQTGLKLHPDYISAHIVYGRCLIDKKDDSGAIDVFNKVLGLDPENIIALRVLSEIAERNGRFDQAVGWLTRLLAADPMNGDAAEALARAKGKAAVAPTTTMAKPDFVVEHTSLTADATPAVSAAKPSPDVETFENTLNANPAAHAAAKADGLEVQEDVELNAQQIEQVEVEGLARTQYQGSGMFKLDGPPPESGSAGAPPAPDLVDDAMPQVDLPLIMPDDPSPARTSAALRPPRPPAPPPPPEPPRVPAAVALSDDDGAADTATLSQAEPVLTETMAELYLKQGHQQDALRVYQALLAQRPGDARLRGKIERLSGGGRKGSGVSAQTFLKGILSGRGTAPAASPPPEIPAASLPEPPPEPPPEEPGTLAAAFEAAEGGDEGPPPGEPSRPATDNISLDSVFDGRQSGGGGGGGGGGAGATSGGAAGEATGRGGFSFDDFFGGTARPSGAGPEAPDARTPGRSSGGGRAQRAAEDEGELDQFQQWLKKLKS